MTGGNMLGNHHHHHHHNNEVGGIKLLHPSSCQSPTLLFTSNQLLHRLQPNDSMGVRELTQVYHFKKHISVILTPRIVYSGPPPPPIEK